MILISCIGLTWILKYSTILEFIRKPLCLLHPRIAELFKCALCLGFWVGCLGVILFNQPVYFPFTSAAVCWFADCLIDLLHLHQIKAEKEIKDDK